MTTEASVWPWTFATTPKAHPRNCACYPCQQQARQDAIRLTGCVEAPPYLRDPEPETP